MKCKKGFKPKKGKCTPGMVRMLFGKKRKLFSVFNVSLALVVLTHIYAIFFEMTEAMWLGHNILMIVAGIVAWRLR